MARLEDIPEPTATSIRTIDCPDLGDPPFVTGPALDQRRIALISSAGLITRGDRPFVGGDADYRIIPADVGANDLLVSHVSVNFDRTGYQLDRNVAFPIDRLAALAADGQIGSVADRHFSFMGATNPTEMEAHVAPLVAQLKADRVDSVVLIPV